MTPLEKELVEALETLANEFDRPGMDRHYYQTQNDAIRAAHTLLARAKQTGTHEFTVEDDGHGRAMVGGRRLASGGMGMSTGEVFGRGRVAHQFGEWIALGTRVRVELRDGVDFATLVRVVTP